MNNTVPVVKIEISMVGDILNKDGEGLASKQVPLSKLSKELKRLKVIDGFTLSAIQLFQIQKS